MRGLRINWLNTGLSVLLLALGIFAGNQWAWHRDEVSGWSLFGFLVLLVLAFITGALVVIAQQQDSTWATVGAFVLGLIVGIGGTVFVINVDVGWEQAVFGLLGSLVAGGLIAGIGLTTWRRP